MNREKTPPSQPVADPVYVPVEVIVDDESCRIELSPAAFCGYERTAHRRRLTVADLLCDTANSMLADRGPLN